MNKKKSKGSPFFFQFLIICSFLLYLAVFIQKKTSSHSNDHVTDSRIDDEFGRNRSLTWQNFSNEKFLLNYYISHNALEESKNKKNSIINYLSFDRSNIRPIDFEEYFEIVYKRTLDNDHELIQTIADSLQVIKENTRPNRYELAETIMTFVQDIPYALVYQMEECSPTEPNPCIDGELFGIHTPTQFLYTLLGDCDTRAILLYGLFKKFGYDPKIAVSKTYQHAMILIDIPTAGTYLWHNNKKYYFWESTAYGWKLGHLPPTVSNVDQWKIAL